MRLVLSEWNMTTAIMTSESVEFDPGKDEFWLFDTSFCSDSFYHMNSYLP